ncbi:AAA family ATPase [Halalkalibacter krulwichiae]|uniref:Chaperone protein ClpB n=1 Tax=Halalkalibacter krulwichiae TaxID=199441 RepID=A0A1X9MF95_9BACI|nr:AAA family ATPase [Halalkalibacter krulwichiae]ARK31314.1 Chaperone protein ClpB [Halalkalibacter krulwichiae]
MNFVVSSDEYAGVREHVIINFNNFLGKFDSGNIYLHNPPLQISEQIKRLYPSTEIKYQDYSSITIENLITLNSTYDSKIIGQENVKFDLLQALFPLTRKNRKKPVVILLYGKSGIGKTETAKLISEVIGEPLFRKQFSMYQNNQFATYLFGGAHYEKSFAKDLLDRESNVILLDEFDKAHTSFHSAFYQLFDEGFYEDPNYSLSLEKSIIICTSNYNNLNEIEEHLGSPIYNRFDKLIQFNDLSNEAKQKIGEKIFQELSRVYENQLSEEVMQRLSSSYIKCENVRQIYHLIEDTFSLHAVYGNLKSL